MTTAPITVDSPPEGYVWIERSRSGTGEAQDLAVHIVKGGTIQTAVNKASPEIWPIADAYKVYGSSEELWGQTWTVADVNGGELGVAIRAETGFNTTTIRIDHISIAVYYTTGADENRICFAGRSIQPATNGVYRQAPEDDVWGRVIEIGFPPTAVPSGLEEQPTRAIIIPTQGDLGELPDAGTNKLSVVRNVRPGFHYSREAAG